ncbi:putative kinesin [Leptomonas seymouri]|uniref:Putative kinesin n=1 Tax=Leptomonas seymouri TaxID=5684 RepID=A0A0N0P404_LEPSE|nr:putative kinesin [Leptomonas seymouri]|eukprot:KPI84257.1 putative kinesin [Leptomonas seymouri]
MRTHSMKHITPLRQSPVNRSAVDRLTSCRRRRATDTIASSSSGRGRGAASARPVRGPSPPARRRGRSIGSSNDSCGGAKKSFGASSFVNRHATSPTKAVASQERSTTSSSPTKLQSASPRQTPAGRWSSSKRRSDQTLTLFSAAAAQAPSQNGNAAAAEGSPRNDAIAGSRQAAQRQPGASSSQKRRSDDGAAPSSGTTVPSICLKDAGNAKSPLQEASSTTAIASTEANRSPPSKLVSSTPNRRMSRVDPVKRETAANTATPHTTPPHESALRPQKNGDDMDILDMGHAPRLVDLPSMAAAGDPVAFQGDGGTLLYAAGSPPLGVHRKSNTWSSEQTNWSLVLNSSDATLPPTTASRRQTLGNDDGDVPRCAEAPGVATGSSNLPPAVSRTTTSPKRGNSPMKLVSAPLLVPSSTAQEGSALKKKSRRASTEVAGTPRETSKSPRAQANASKATTDPALQKGHGVAQQSLSPLKKKPQPKRSGSDAAVGPASSSMPNHAASPHTPAKTVTAGTRAAAAAGSGSPPKTPRASFSLYPSAKGAEDNHNRSNKQRGAAPSNTTASAAATTANHASPPQKQNPPQSTLHNPRAAAKLSQMLSVVRPMAPVVHVRIRPVLPSIGETSHQRHVYLLDHENVMITGTRSGFNANTTGTSAVASNLLSSTTDWSAAKHSNSDTHGGTDGSSGVGTVRSHGDVLSESSTVLANSANIRWRSSKAALCPNSSAVADSGSTAGGGGGGLTSPSPATLYAGNSALLMSAPENQPPSHDVAYSGTLMETKRHSSRNSPNAAPGSARLQLLSLPGTISVQGTCSHPRTTSWLSQGSEDVAMSSLVSGRSHSASRSQHGLPLGGASTSLTSAVSTPRTRPRLAAFAALTEDTPLSSTATPQEPAASNAAVGAEEVNKRCGGRRVSALMQRSVSLSTMTAPGSRATTRKNSMVSSASAVGLQKSGRAANGARRPVPRSAFGVSAMAMPTLSKANSRPLGATEDLQHSRASPLHDVLVGSPTFADVSCGATVASSTNGPCGNGSEQHYSFEFVHGEEAMQADVFEESVLRFADEALLAQNVALICYGPTGSGKTYSMMGSQVQASSGAAAPSPNKALRTQGSAPKFSGKATSGRNTPLRTGGSPAGRCGSDSGRATSATEGRRHLADDSASSGVAQGDSTNRRDRSIGLMDDDEDESNTWPQLGSSWQYGYTDRFVKRSATTESSRVGGEGGGDNGCHRDDQAGAAAAGNVMTSAGMAEMGILPRLVHTLLERRGEAITIRREPGRDGGGASAAAGSTANSPQPTPRPVNASKATSLSLTLCDLTFYGIELYMDELCDLLDPGKRPIQAVSDSGGLAALCQRINEARDYRISGNRGGASHACVTSPRAGGGMSISSLADLRRAYRLAHSNRVTSKHAQNDTSSRSHAIFLLQLDFDLVESHLETTQQQRRCDGTAGTAAGDAAEAPAETVQHVHSYVAMVDLAGCERVKQTKVEGVALREAQYINKSLSALSSVVLSLHRHNAHVPYRDSKLTRLLRPCLEGGRVLTLVHVAPCSSTETINTLKFADQIRHTHIPTHMLTPTSSKHRELLDVFADLIDPMQGLWEAQVRHAQLQLNRLCADVRLAYFSRAVGAVARHGTANGTLSRGPMSSDAVSEVSALTDAEDSTSLSPADVSLEEGPLPLSNDATEKEKRTFALHSLMHGLMGPIHQFQHTSMRDAIRAIRRRKEHRIASHEQQLQQRMEKLQSAVEKLTAMNAKLANENRTPLPCDPYALELNRQLRETSEQISETTKEQAALSTLSAALRQRLANQDMLEATVDEQLRNVQHRTAQALQMLSAAAAAHPPGVVSSQPSATLSVQSSPREPTLPTGSLVPAAIAIETDDDPELRDIAHQQISLAKELAALRLETACFEIATGVWEGLWARAMRKEIVTALEVEVFAMERILLDRRALSLMLMDDDEDGEEEGAEEEGGAGPSADTFSTPVKATACGGDEKSDGDVAVARQRSSVPTTARLPNRTASPGNLAAVMRSALWTRLGTYLQGKVHQSNTAEAPASDPVAAAAVTGYTAVRGADSRSGSPRTPPPPPPSPSPWRHDRLHLSQATNSEASEPRSVEGLRTRSGVGALCSRPGLPSFRIPQKPTEELMLNPLTVLAMACDEAARQRPRSSSPHLERSMPNSFTPPPSPQRAETTRPTADVGAALFPLTISGTYGDEQALQEACLQLLLRDGISCEACCMGSTANHVLQRYVLPGTADAPLAEEINTAEKTTAAAAASTTNAAPANGAAVHYAVKTLLSTQHDTAGHSDGAGAAAAVDRRNASGGADAPIPPPPPSLPAHTPHVRSGAVTGASCTTRFGRLRLVRVPRRPNCYVLEFVYTHQGLPMPPRMQAARTGKPEQSLTPTPRRTNLEQMVDSLPTVHGVAGRGGARAQGSLKEHRLFAIPLHEPSLHLHLHVLEEGIPDMTTPVAATWAAPADTTGAALADSSAAEAQTSSSLCLARRSEPGSQIVLEVQGVPYTASTRRAPIIVSAKEAKTPPFPGNKNQKATGATGKAARKFAAPGSDDGAKGYSQLPTGTKKSTSKAAAPAHAGTEPLSSPGHASAGWNDLVLAKRLSGGGELMLPSSCILSNRGCCSLVLRFPHPFFTSMARTENVEAIVGALCGILRPALKVPEMRLSARTARTPSKKSSMGRRRRSASPRTASGGADRGNYRSSSSGGNKRRRGSQSHTPRREDGDRAMELDVITYAHVPYTMFAAEAPAAEKDEATGAASMSASVEPVASPPAAAGRVVWTPSSSHSASMARSDSLDGLMGSGSGVLGHTLQSSCSPAQGNFARAHAPFTGANFCFSPSSSLVRTPSESTATATVPAIDQQNGATLQVQFHWVPTPLDVEPPRGGTNVKGSGAQHFSLDEHERAEEARAEPPFTPRREIGVRAVDHLPRRRVDESVRHQLRSALGILARLSYVFVGAPSALSETSTAESSMSDVGPHVAREGARERVAGGVAQPLAPRKDAQVSRYKHAISVAALLRQLDTYRQRIRRLFRQQLYDAEDVLGDDVQLGGPERGAYMRDVQAEVRQAIGLPGGAHGQTPADGGFSSLGGSPTRLDKAETGHRGTNNGDRNAEHPLLSPESGETGPNAQVTIPEAREVCGVTVPWSIWQWAYRWSQLRRLLVHHDQDGQSHAAVETPNSGVFTTRVDAAAVWLPVHSRVLETPVVAHAGHAMATLTSLPVTTSAGYTSSSSSSSSEGYAMEGDWLNVARFAARSKRMWLSDVLSTTVPSYLESCAADYAA